MRADFLNKGEIPERYCTQNIKSCLISVRLLTVLVRLHIYTYTYLGLFGGFSMDKSGICKQSFRVSNIRTPSKLGLFGGGGGSLWIKVKFANNLLESRTFERHPSSYK